MLLHSDTHFLLAPRGAYLKRAAIMLVGRSES
jgi:hypothetical protein